jgi:hypothetical protein
VILAHIAGLPVEETLLSFAPMGAIGIGAAVCSARSRLRERSRGTSRPPGASPPAGDAGEPLRRGVLADREQRYLERHS